VAHPQLGNPHVEQPSLAGAKNAVCTTGEVRTGSGAKAAMCGVQVDTAGVKPTTCVEAAGVKPTTCGVQLLTTGAEATGANVVTGAAHVVATGTGVTPQRRIRHRSNNPGRDHVVTVGATTVGWKNATVGVAHVLHCAADGDALDATMLAAASAATHTARWNWLVMILLLSQQ